MSWVQSVLEWIPNIWNGITAIWNWVGNNYLQITLFSAFFIDYGKRAKISFKTEDNNLYIVNSGEFTAKNIKVYKKKGPLSEKSKTERQFDSLRKGEQEKIGEEEWWSDPKEEYFLLYNWNFFSYLIIPFILAYRKIVSIVASGFESLSVRFCNLLDFYALLSCIKSIKKGQRICQEKNDLYNKYMDLLVVDKFSKNKIIFCYTGNSGDFKKTITSKHIGNLDSFMEKLYFVLRKYNINFDEATQQEKLQIPIEESPKIGSIVTLHILAYLADFKHCEKNCEFEEFPNQEGIPAQIEIDLSEPILFLKGDNGRDINSLDKSYKIIKHENKYKLISKKKNSKIFYIDTDSKRILVLDRLDKKIFSYANEVEKFADFLRILYPKEFKNFPTKKMSEQSYRII